MQDLSWLTAQPIAHRGFHDMNRGRWENTPAAFAAAIERRYAIECDVHLSSDGVPVVFHDEQLKRLTGQDGRIWQRTAAELTALRIGGTEERIPTLAQMLDLVAGRVPLVIEIKGVPGHDAGLVESVLKCLTAYEGPAAIMSFDHWILRDLASRKPPFPIGLTACGQSESELEAHFSMLAHGLSFTSYAVADLPNAFVTFLRERLSMPIITWTVRKEAEVEATFRHGDQMTFEGFAP